VLQHIVACCSAFQCVQCVAMREQRLWAKGIKGEAVCCSVLQCVAVCCNVVQCVAVCYSVLQCVAVCCGVLQCLACHAERQ